MHVVRVLPEQHGREQLAAPRLVRVRLRVRVRVRVRVRIRARARVRAKPKPEPNPNPPRHQPLEAGEAHVQVELLRTLELRLR